MGKRIRSIIKGTFIGLTQSPMSCWEHFSVSSFAGGLDRPSYQTVTMPLGTVSGAYLAFGVTRYTLPYAQAPVGSLRFMVSCNFRRAGRSRLTPGEFTAA